MPEAAKELLKLEPARIGEPMQEIPECPPEYLTQEYLGAMALACYPHLKTWHADLHSLPGRRSPIKKVPQWFTDLF